MFILYFLHFRIGTQLTFAQVATRQSQTQPDHNLGFSLTLISDKDELKSWRTTPILANLTSGRIHL